MDIELGTGTSDLFVDILYGISGCGMLLNLLLIFTTLCCRRASKSEFDAFVVYIALLDVSNLLLLTPECLYILRGWTLSEALCRVFSGLDAFVNVSLAYTIVIFAMSAMTRTQRVQHAILDPEEEDEYHNYEVAEAYLEPVRKKPSWSVWPMLFLVILGVSVAVPYLLLSEVHQQTCSLDDHNSVSVRSMILLLRKIVPLLLMCVILLFAICQRCSGTRQSMSRKNQKLLNVAITCAFTFLLFSSGRLFVTTRSDDDVYSFLALPARLYLALLHYMASVLRPIFVLAALRMRFGKAVKV